MNSKRFLGAFTLLSVIFCLLCPPAVSAQQWTLFKKNDDIDCRYFSTDHQKNIYIVTHKNELLKYDGEGYFDSRFSFKKFGKIGSIDVTNPFKIILYYTDYQCIAVIDAALNPIKTLFLNDMGVANAGGLAMSDAGDVWVFDSGVNKFLRYSIDASGFKLAATTPPLSMTGLQPTQMLVRDNLVYMNVPSKGIVVFDQFGKYIKTLNILNASSLQIIDNQLFYQQNNKYFRFNLQTLATTTINLPEGVSGDRFIQMQKGRLYAQRGTSVDVFDEKQ